MAGDVQSVETVTKDVRVGGQPGNAAPEPADLIGGLSQASPAMHFAYADPPYLGCCNLYQHEHGDDGWCWDDLDTHERLVERLCAQYTDGWALSASTPSLWDLLPLCPREARVGAWLKSFASFKPNVNPGYCWEPVIYYGGRQPRSRTEPTVRDFIVAPITLRRGLTGAKPTVVGQWILDFLGYREGDTIDDLYPGTNAIARALSEPVLL